MHKPQMQVRTFHKVMGKQPVREDGKYIKPAGWTPPDIEGVLRRIKDGA